MLETGISGFEYYPSGNKPAAFIAAPILKKSNVIGILAFQLGNEEIYELIQDYTDLGETGETVVAAKIGDEAVVIAPLRHYPHAAFNRKVGIGSYKGLSIQKAVQGIRGFGISRDYRDKKVLSVWRYFPQLEWGIVVKIDTKEAFAPVVKLRNWSLIIGFSTILAIILIALFVSKSISKPIYLLAEGIETIAGGSLDFKVGTAAKDEIGQLSRAFDNMRVKLKEFYAGLEQKIQERTEELAKSLEETEKAKTEADKETKELEKLNKFMIGREKRMGELKQEIKELKKRLGESEETDSGKERGGL